MEDLKKLEELSLVSKVCTELENHLGFNDKDVAECFIKIASKCTTVEKFKAQLDKFPNFECGEGLSVSNRRHAGTIMTNSVAS